jgi:hypothetical protein
MKNFKKVLALVLAVATLLSFATIASAVSSSSYKDAADITKNGQTEAIDVLSGIGVLTGYPDTTFKPNQDITRAEAAKIIAMFDNGATDISALYASANPFTDVKGNWAESYIAYGYKAGIIAGVGKLLFAPSAKLTGVQFLKMVLVVLGYDAKIEGLEGASWAVNTLSLAKKAGLLDGLGTSFNPAANLLRGQAAQIMLNALKANTVEYGTAIKFTEAERTQLDKLGALIKDKYNYLTVAGAIDTGKALSEVWNLTYVSSTRDNWGRPGHVWNVFSGSKKGTTAYGPYIDTPLATYKVATKMCDIYKDTGLAVKKALNIYTNGKDNLDDKTILTDTVDLLGAQGQLMEVYADRTVVLIDTYLAKVTKVVPSGKDSNGHASDPVTTVTVYEFGVEKDASLTYTTEAFKLGDMVLVNICNGEIDTMTAATSKNGKLSKLNVAYSYTAPVQAVAEIDNTAAAVNHTAKFDADATPTLTLGDVYLFYYDTYGNVIGIKEATGNFAVIDSICRDTVSGKSTITATIYTPDAKPQTVKVNSIDNVKVGLVSYYYNGQSIEQDENNNLDLYRHLFLYSMNSDGTCDLTTYNKGVGHKVPTGIEDQTEFIETYGVSGIVYTAGDKFIDTWVPVYNEDKNTVVRERHTVQINDATVFLVQKTDSPSGTFVSYTGYASTPSLNGDGQVVMDEANNYATLVYVNGSSITTKTAFVPDITSGSTKVLNDGRYEYSLNVLTLDENGKLNKDTIIFTDTNDENLPDFLQSRGISNAGLYTFTINNDKTAAGAREETLYNIDSILATGRYQLSYTAVLDTGDKPLYTRWTGAYDATIEGAATVKDVTEQHVLSELAKNDSVYVQYTDTNKNGYFDEADKVTAVYDMYLAVKVNVRGTEVNTPAEYLNHAFTPITVGLKEYEMIGTATMVGSSDNTLVAGDPVTSDSTVTGDITITVENKGRYTNTKLVAADRDTLPNALNKINVWATNTVRVEVKKGTLNFTLAQLRTYLTTKEQNASYKFYNSTVDANGLITDETQNILDFVDKNDLKIEVTAWDQATKTTYIVNVVLVET